MEPAERARARTLAELLGDIESYGDELTIYTAPTGASPGEAEAVAAIEPDDGAAPAR